MVYPNRHSQRFLAVDLLGALTACVQKIYLTRSSRHKTTNPMKKRINLCVSIVWL